MSLSSNSMDVLKEVGNIGAGHAATALSKLLNRKIDMFVPSVTLETFNDVIELAGGADREVVSVFLRLEGDARGSIFFIMSVSQAEEFASKLTGIDQEVVLEEEMTTSALMELGNILAGSYITALSDFTSLNLWPSVPALSYDMLGAILSTGLLEVSQEGDRAIMIETVLTNVSHHQERINGHFFLFPAPASLPVIKQSLGGDGKWVK